MTPEEAAQEFGVEEDLIVDTHYELDDFDQVLNSKKVGHHVSKVEGRRRRELPRSVDEDALADLIALDGAIRLVEHDKDAFLDSKGAANVDKSWDVEEFITGLRESRDELLEETEGQWAVSQTRYGTHRTY